MMTLFAAAVLLSAVVFIHELGHYLAARSIGVKVEQFSVGFPPRLATFTSVPGGWEVRLFFFKRNEKGAYKWSPVVTKKLPSPSKKGTGTEYCLSMIPFGGYVKVAGMIDESMDATLTQKPYELMSKARWKQIWFMSAGVIMNTILAFVIFVGLSNSQGKSLVSNDPVIHQVIEGKPASQIGLAPGDLIRSIDKKSVFTWDDLTSEIQQKPNQSIELSYLRNGKEKLVELQTTYQINPFNGDSLGMIGISPEFRNATFTESISMGARATANGFRMVILTIKMLTSGKASVKQLGGPLMIAQLAGESAKAGWAPFLSLMALISCNLAFLNILPIPGLDGGHIFITLIEGAIRRPLSIKMRIGIQQLGVVLILMLMVTVMINDIGRLFGD